MSGPDNISKNPQNPITTLIEHIDVRAREREQQEKNSIDLLRGPSTDINLMECHYSVLAPDQMMHPPHIHEEEEIQIVVEGQAELIAEDAKNTNNMERFSAKPGDFIYHPANWKHCCKNRSDKPAVCVAFKWKTDDYQSNEILKSTFVQGSEKLARREEPEERIKFDLLLKGKTTYLRTLQGHMAILQPGQGYEPHPHDYDIGIIHFEGQVETLGETVHAPAFIYYAAGQIQGMKNTGNTVAKHIAFELHGKQGELYESPRSRRRRKLKESLTHPMILINHLKWLVNNKLK